MLPAVRFIQNESVNPALQPGFKGFVLFQAVEVFQKGQPGGLLSVVEFGGSTGLFPQHIVDIFEGLFEHAAEFTVNRHDLQGAKAGQVGPLFGPT